MIEISPDSATSHIHNEWFPVAAVADTRPSSWHPFELLDDRYLLTVASDGTVFVTHDTCPHRGAQLSLGTFDGNRVQCAYHGWEFDTAGRCVHQPAHPDRSPPATMNLNQVAAQERFGLWWVCVGPNPGNLPSFAPYEQAGRNLVISAARVQTSGPRIVENFLDLAHFPFVHADYLGQVPHTSVERYGVRVDDEGVLQLTDCLVWQPNPGPRATQGGPVRYNYSVSHPYAATLTKVPSEHDGGDIGGFSILLIASPITEVSCLVWRVVAVVDPNVDETAQRDFNRTIFEQDVPIIESQRPKRLPVGQHLERHQPADAGSLAYRKWLVARGITYGTTT